MQFIVILIEGNKGKKYSYSYLANDDREGKIRSPNIKRKKERKRHIIMCVQERPRKMQRPCLPSWRKQRPRCCGCGCMQYVPSSVCGCVLVRTRSQDPQPWAFQMQSSAPRCSSPLLFVQASKQALRKHHQATQISQLRWPQRPSSSGACP